MKISFVNLSVKSNSIRFVCKSKFLLSSSLIPSFKIYSHISILSSLQLLLSHPNIHEYKTNPPNNFKPALCFFPPRPHKRRTQFQYPISNSNYTFPSTINPNNYKIKIRRKTKKKHPSFLTPFSSLPLFSAPASKPTCKQITKSN